MSFDKSAVVRSLVPKSYHFDGYNELNCPNSRDKPFFTDNVVQLGKYYLKTRMANTSTLYLEYDSICPRGEISFTPYKLTLESFVSKLQEAIQNGSDVIAFEIQPSYGNFDDCRNHCDFKNNDCIQLQRNHPPRAMAAVSFDMASVQNALAAYFGITSKKQKNNNGGTSMKNLFGMNFEFGMSKDRNIAATFMGVAVKSPTSGDWYTFNPATNSRKNIANLKFGDFPIFLLPSKTLAVGDLTKMEGKYYYVKAAGAETITLIGAEDGIIREMLPTEGLIPGMNFYTKVVAIDPKSLMDPASKQGVGNNIIAAMCMMQWSKGAQEFSLDNIGKDDFNGLGSFMPMLMMSGEGGLSSIFGGTGLESNLPMLMMMGSQNGNGDENGFMQMMALSSLLGNDSKSPISGLMSDIVATVAPTTSENGVICESCSAEYPSGTNFCKECGCKTKPKTMPGDAVCEKCGAVYPAGTKFCKECGGKTKAITTACACGAALLPDAKYCSNCGAKVGQDACPQCGKNLDAHDKFCSNCGYGMSNIVPYVELAPKPKKPTAPKKKVTSAPKETGGDKDGTVNP